MAEHNSGKGSCFPIYMCVYIGDWETTEMSSTHAAIVLTGDVEVEKEILYAFVILALPLP